MAGLETTFIESRRILVLVGVAVLGIFALPLVLFCLYGRLGLEAASVMITGILTLSLVLLYFQQYKVLEGQSALMERDYQSAVVKRGPVVAKEDEVTVQLENQGRGTVQQMYLRSEIASSTGSLVLSPGRSLLASDDDSLTLSPFSELTEFTGTVNLVWETDDDERVLPFSYFTSRLLRRGIETCVIELTLEIIDEGTVDKESIKEFTIAEQEVDFSVSEEGMAYPATKLSDSLPSKYPSNIVAHDSPLFTDEIIDYSS